MNIEVLKAELLAGHPETGAYDADNQIAADQINAVNVERNKTSMTGREMAANIVDAEYDILSDTKKSQVLALTGANDIDPFGFVANVLKDVFDIGSVTITNLQAARVETVSQATVLGLGFVYEGHIEAARAL
jgi:predicted TIM-barrel enzyme